MKKFILCNNEVCEGDDAVDVLQKCSDHLNRISAGDFATPKEATADFLKEHNLFDKEYHDQFNNPAE